MTHHSLYNTLLVTPDQTWSLLLYEHLAQNGFAPVTVAPTGDSALTLLHQVAPRLVLIDLGLPDCNLADLCTAMRLAQPAMKVILITKNGAEAPPAALASGVSGCIDQNLPLEAWPGLLTYILQGGMAFSHTRVETALMEARAMQNRQPPLVIGALRIDLSQRLVMHAGQRILLTAREFALLAYLAGHPDRVVTVDQLLSDAWGFDANSGTPAQVRLYIARLRRKLLANSQTPDFIHTERGVGYRLNSAALR